MGFEWHNKKCLVTGGAGFGGSHLCEQLTQLGATVVMVDLQLSDLSYFSLAGLQHKIEYVQGEVRDLELMQSVIQKNQVDTLFHLAAQPIVPLSNQEPLETMDINVRGTYTLLDSARLSSTVATRSS